MSIKDIAKMAGVSISTVSKIVNGKADNISQKTQDKVLALVKEYNYSPYSAIKAGSAGKTFLLGVLLRAGKSVDPLLRGISETARAAGYSLLVCVSSNEEEEQRNLALLSTHRVCGVIWEQLSQNNVQFEKQLAAAGIPYALSDANQRPSTENHTIDYWQMGYAATRRLIDQKHQNIACLVRDSGAMSELFCQGYRQCMLEQDIPSDVQALYRWDQDQAGADMFLRDLTGAVCLDVGIAADVYEQAEHGRYRIPRDLSIVALDHDGAAALLSPRLTAIRLPYYELGRFSCQQLIGKIEIADFLPSQLHPPLVIDGDSVDVPVTVRNKKIIVVGALNIDTLVNVGCFPKVGETTTAKSRVMIPGGKGVNQSIGVARLGAESYLIGCLGKDYEGSRLHSALSAENVNTVGVRTDRRAATGHAYVYVQDDGESSILIYEGANRSLVPRDIDDNAALFQNASFCLLQTEIPKDVVLQAAKTARRHGVKVILKPAAIADIDDELLQNVDIFLPNRNELDTLCTLDIPLEEKAQLFLDRGVGQIIVTLSQDGCYLRDAEHSRYFAAAEFAAVDTTGAADAFAATLAVYLSEGHSITGAIPYANYAAGFSITRQGVPPALVDRDTLELNMSGR